MFRKILLLIALSGVLLGCEMQQDTPTPPAKKLKLALAMQPSNGLTIIALEKGFFQEQGLDIEISRYPSGKRAMKEGLLAGKADITNASDVPVVKQAFDSDDMVILATAFNADNVNRIIARSDSEIQTPQDLKGKHIATQQASAVHFFMHLFLLENGMNESQLNVSYMKAEQLPNALAKGEIDAFSMREPFISQAKALLGDNSVVFAAPGAYRQLESVITTRTFLQANPELIERFLKALLKAEHYTQTHAQSAQKIIADNLKVPVTQIRNNWQQYQFDLSLSQSSVILLEDIARWMLYQGITDHETIPNFLNKLAIEPLQKVKPEAVTVIR